MLFNLSQVINIKEELNEFHKLCLSYSHKPTEEEISEVIHFILLNSGASTSGTMTESYSTMLSLMESSDLFTDLGEIGNSVTGALTKGLTSDALGIGAAGTVLAMGAKSLGGYIVFLFKKSKLKANLNKEKQLNQTKINAFLNLAKMKQELAKLKGEEPKLTSILP